jgi:hypothetical protein
MKTQTKRKIEVFTAGCPVCEPVVEMVKSTACSDCEVIVYNIAETSKNTNYLDKVKTYGIKALPAVAVNGKLLSCCQNNGVSEAELKSSGIGQPV